MAALASTPTNAMELWVGGLQGVTGEWRGDTLDKLEKAGKTRPRDLVGIFVSGCCVRLVGLGTKDTSAVESGCARNTAAGLSSL